jgi:hypothetical protein
LRAGVGVHIKVIDIIQLSAFFHAQALTSKLSRRINGDALVFEVELATGQSDIACLQNIGERFSL